MKKKPAADVTAFEEFYNEKGLEPVRDFDTDHGSGLWEAETKAHIDTLSLKNLFFSEDWVYILVSKYASRIAAQKLSVVSKTDRTQKAAGHPVQTILNNPNSKQDYYQWMYCIVCDLVLMGNGMTWKCNNQLLYIPSESVVLKFHRSQPTQYEVVRYNDGIESQSLFKIPFNEMAHAKRPNPGSVYWGLSPFIPGTKSVLFNRYSSEFLNNYYIKGAQPGLIIEMLEGANEREALRLLRGMELSYTGRKNQRRNMVLPKGVKATPAQTTLADQQLKDYIDKNRENIINLLEVPKHELSIASSGSLGSEEYKIALRNFWRGPLQSTMDSITGVLNKVFAAQLGSEYEIIFDLSDVEAIQEDSLKKTELAIKQMAFKSINEIRKEFGLEPKEGLDAVGTQAAAPAVSSFQTFAAPTIEQKRIGNFNLFTQYKSKDPKWWEEREAIIKEGFDKASEGVRKNFLGVLANQIIEVLPIIDSMVKIEKDAYSKVRLKKKITDALNKFEEDYVNGNVTELEITLDTGYQSMLKVPFNLPNEEQLQSFRDKNKARRKQRLEDQQIQTFSQINKTTTDKILSRIDQGIEKGETIQEITKGVREHLIDAGAALSRADTIARTETLMATSLGQSAAMQDAASVIPNLKKMWINAGDERVRGNPGGLYPESKADHWVLQGEVKNHDKKFSNGMMFPRDPSGEPHDFINCRCSWIVIPAEDASSIGLEDLDSNVE